MSPIINPLRKWGHLSAEVVKNYLQPAMSRFKDMADYYHMPEVNEKFARLRTAVKISEHQMMLVTNYTAEVLKGYDGKGMDANESARFMEYMEANREDVKGRILKDLFEDNTSSPAAKHFLGNVEKTRDILGRTPTTGMFATLGLESSKFEVSWMTRLMKKIAGDPTWANKYADMGDAGAQAMMRDLYANNVPKQLDFQSRYMRVSDFVDLARDINSLRALTNYYRQGLFWLYAGPALEEFYNATHTENTPAPLRLRADHYIRVTIAGVKNDLAGVNAAVIRELGMMSSDGKDAANLILNLGTAGIFIGKPWSAVRQVFDAYASAAPILGGNRFLDEGFRWANKEYKKNLQGGVDARYLNERLQTSEPTARGERFLGWYFTKSHSLVQGGDVLPRMAIYRAGQLQFERGMEVMAKNPALRIEDALYSWPYLTNPEQVQAAWLRGDYAAAQHVFADNLQEQTSGSFRPQDQGMLRNSFGFFGRAWGQLMTMVMQMNDLRLRVLTKGTPGQRVLTTSIMAKNMAMIAAGLNIAGVDGSSFLPWSDLTVSGGPVFNEMLQIVMLTQGDAAERSRRLRILAGTVLAQTVPFETLLQRAVRTVDFMGKKQYWKAMLAVTATPIAKGSYVNMLTGKPFMEKPPKKE